MKLSFFISYSRRDEHTVYRYADDIKKHLNVTTWLDKVDIPTGADWWKGICEGIRDCDFFMFFLSPHSANSKYCMAELQYAHALNKVILPIMIAETSPLPDIIDKNRINYYNLVHYKDSRDVLLGLSKDIFHHLTNPRTMDDIAPPLNPDDKVSKTSKTKPIGNSRELFQQANNAFAKGDFDLAHSLFRQVTGGNNLILTRISNKKLRQIDPVLKLQHASQEINQILSLFDDGLITQDQTEEEYTDFKTWVGHSDYPPTLKDIQAESYQRAYQKIMSVQRERAIELDLRDLNLTFVPPEIGLLTQLSVLDLSNNQLTTVPESISNLSQLTKLHLDNNQLTSLPESIGNLSQLKNLQLHYNELTSLPESIGSISQLKLILLSFNQLTSLPKSIGKLSQLQGILLGDNQLTNLPESFGNLSQLRELALENNKLTNLPESIGNLSQLQCLYLGRNQLTTIPEGISKLSQLTELYLGRNQLTTIPEGISKLSQLTLLSLDHNHINDLPSNIGLLDNLEYFTVDENPLTDLPNHVERTNEAILKWLREEARKV